MRRLIKRTAVLVLVLIVLAVVAVVALVVYIRRRRAPLPDWQAGPVFADPYENEGNDG
jgi:preprotein translocase subunit SecY